MSRSTTNKNAALLSRRGSNEKNYKVFAVNFYGTSLEPIRQEFTKMGLTGMRRRVIIVDMETERRRALEQKPATAKSTLSKSNSALKRKQKTGFELNFGDFSDAFLTTARSENAGRDSGSNSFDLTVAIMAIHRLRREYEEATLNLAKEREFNLFDYWNASLDKPTVKRKASLTNSKSIDKELLKKKRLTAIKEDEEMPNISCSSLTPLPHNKIGRPASMLKIKFIEDEPLDSKLFIILIGKFDKNFYLDLIRRGEPLQAIINFLPGEVPYDLLLPNPEYKTFLSKTLDDLQTQIYELRQKIDTKPTGIFRQYLPKISECLAAKYARKIYDEVTWAFYDIEMLHRNYLDYYYIPFRVYNVAMPKSVSLDQAFYVTEALHLQGNYLQNPFPAVTADISTVILYMDMLFSTIDHPKDVLTEWETLLLSTPLPKRIYSIYQDSVNSLAKQYADAFLSITKIKKVERLFVEENNTSLIQMVQYVDHELFRHIYLACLEYKIQRKYINNKYHRDAVPFQKYDDERHNDGDNEGFDLPGFAKLYTTDDGVIQRLLTLLDDYDNFVIKEIRPAHKLYEFSRTVNEIIEHNRMFTIPTRLCFREFTLFRLEEFLANLITEEMKENRATENMTDIERFEMMMRRLAQDYNPDIFIRPNSLKARRAVAVSALLGLKISQRRNTVDSTRERELQMAADALMGFSSRKSAVGIPYTHSMMQGYNLEDIRQEIWVKDSKYYFEEGSIKLYEEKWNFTDMNKNLSLNINGSTLILGTPREAVFELEPLIRVITNNEVAVRVLPDSKECSKIVINYPNGLSIYYQEKHTEQIWSREETPANEKRRIVTPYGAVIVQYHSDDMVLIMRYNGEVYRLYQYEFVFSEGDGEELNSMTARSSNERNTLTSTRSKLLLHMLQRDNTTEKTDRSDYSRIPPEARPMKAEQRSTKKKQKRDLKQSAAGGDMGTLSLGSSLSLGSYISDREPDQSIIDDELRFLNGLITEYGLSYKHLILTTSIGKVYNLTHLQKFYESVQMANEEWHDYFVDESYAMRDDGVRMIWGMDYLKCFHADGTVITTALEDVLHTFHFSDEFAEAISESSSHKHYEEDTVGDGISTSPSHKISPQRKSTPKPPRSPSYIEKNDVSTTKRSRSKNKRQKSYEPFLKPLGEGEAEDVHLEPTHPGFICALIGTQQIHHRNYASVYFLPLIITYEDIKYIMEVKGADDIVIQKAREPLPKYDDFTIQSSTTASTSEGEEAETIEEALSYTRSTGGTPDITGGDGAGYGDVQITPEDKPSLVYPMPRKERSTSTSFVQSKSLHMTSPQTMSTTSSTLPSITHLSRREAEETADSRHEEEEIIFRDVLKVWIGTDFYLIASEDDLELQAMINRYGGRHHKEKSRKTIKFKIAYDENPQDIFHTMVARIASFKRYFKKTTQKMYFLEKLTRDCNLKGLEFLENLPDLGKYHFELANTITQFTPLETIFEKFAKHFDWYEKDLAKFPRFRIKPEKKKTPLDEFPMVLSANIFMKIPNLLRNTNEIHKFVAPLDRVNFKKTRHQIKETMNQFIYPYLKLEVKKLASQLNWREHHEEQLRRKMVEAQRKGLYHAMLRHKNYPKYFMFQDKFNGRAECIDYFVFCLESCMEKRKPSQIKTLVKPKRQKILKCDDDQQSMTTTTAKYAVSTPTSQMISPKMC